MTNIILAVLAVIGVSFACILSWLFGVLMTAEVMEDSGVKRELRKRRNKKW